MTLPAAALLAATLTSGLSAGLFFAWFFSVMPGLAAADDRTFVTAMYWLNIKIVNGWLALTLLGGLVLTAIAVVLHWNVGGALRGWLIAGLALFILTLVITGVGNIPLNNQLDANGNPDSAVDFAAVRQAFEAPWVRWNIMRTVTSVSSFACLLWSLILSGRSS